MVAQLQAIFTARITSQKMKFAYIVKVSNWGYPWNSQLVIRSARRQSIWHAETNNIHWTGKSKDKKLSNLFENRTPSQLLRHMKNLLDLYILPEHILWWLLLNHMTQIFSNPDNLLTKFVNTQTHTTSMPFRIQLNPHTFQLISEHGYQDTDR